MTAFFIPKILINLVVFLTFAKISSGIIMKLLFTLLFLAQISLMAQSAFDYGQNQNVYFISSQQRQQMGIENIYIIDFNDDKNSAAMWGNGSINVINFDLNTISDNWTPMELDTNLVSNLDSLFLNVRFLNGSRYEFDDFGQLISYGGGGYGSFDWKEITRFSDTLSIIETSCVGHCGKQPIKYSKNVFTKNGILTHVIKYPVLEIDFEQNEEPEQNTLENYDAIFRQLIEISEVSPDTLYYIYDKNNRLLSMDNVQEETGKKLFSVENQNHSNVFHQCYIGNIEMENFFLEKIGIIPSLILIEIYQHGVFSFRLDANTNKYYSTETIIMED